MEVKGHGADVFRIPRRLTDLADGVLVDLIDGHIQAYIVRRGAVDVLQYAVVGIAANGVVSLAVAVQAEQDKVGLRQIDGVGAVGDHVDDEKAHFLGFDHKIPQSTVAVPPQKGLSAAEEQDPHPHVIELLHFLPDLRIGVDHGGDVIDRAMLAFEVAFIGDDHSTQNRILLTEQDGLDTKPSQRKKRG